MNHIYSGSPAEKCKKIYRKFWVHHLAACSQGSVSCHTLKESVALNFNYCIGKILLRWKMPQLIHMHLECSLYILYNPLITESLYYPERILTKTKKKIKPTTIFTSCFPLVPGCSLKKLIRISTVSDIHNLCLVWVHNSFPPSLYTTKWLLLWFRREKTD